MVILPIGKKLKKKIHLGIAQAQDLLIMEIYRFFPKAVIHGGTAIWRCYGSNRFSEDIDVYLPSFAWQRLNDFAKSLKERGFEIEKFKKTDNSVFLKLSYGGQIIRFEAIRKNIKHYKTANFEMTDGTFVVANTLKPEELVVEKINTYLKRRKAKDLYDIFFLLRLIENKTRVSVSLKNFLEKFERPLDEKELKILIIAGAISQVEDMLAEIKKWAR